MQYLLEYVIVGLFLLAIALLAGLWLLHNAKSNIMITWKIIKIGPNATVTVSSSSRITKCSIVSGRGSCNIIHDRCICNIVNNTVIKVCSYSTCKFITVR